MLSGLPNDIWLYILKNKFLTKENLNTLSSVNKFFKNKIATLLTSYNAYLKSFSIKDVRVWGTDLVILLHNGKLYRVSLTLKDGRNEKPQVISFPNNEFVRVIDCVDGYLYALTANKKLYLATNKVLKLPGIPNINHPILYNFYLFELPAVEQVSINENFALVRTDVGDVYAWGDNSDGKFGMDMARQQYNSPVKLSVDNISHIITCKCQQHIIASRSNKSIEILSDSYIATNSSVRVITESISKFTIAFQEKNLVITDHANVCLKFSAYILSNDNDMYFLGPRNINAKIDLEVNKELEWQKWNLGFKVRHFTISKDFIFLVSITNTFYCYTSKILKRGSIGYSEGALDFPYCVKEIVFSPEERVLDLFTGEVKPFGSRFIFYQNKGFNSECYILTNKNLYIYGRGHLIPLSLDDIPEFQVIHFGKIKEISSENKIGTNGQIKI